MWLARLACRLMPQPDRIIFLDAPPDVLLSRKQEVPAERLEKARRTYLALCGGDPRFATVDASQLLPSVIASTALQLPSIM